MRAVLFDLDGVIRVWDPEILARAEREADLPPGAIASVAFSPDLLQRVVTGRFSDDRWREHIAERLRVQHPDADAQMAIRLWSEPVGRVDEQVLQIVRKCRQSCVVLLISNATSRLRSDLEALGISDDFDHVINTSEIGYAKPDPRAFEAALSWADAAPDDVLFVDDTRRHVEAARSLGIRTHHYEGVEALQRQLGELGVI